MTGTAAEVVSATPKPTSTRIVCCAQCGFKTILVDVEHYRSDAAYYCGDACRKYAIRWSNQEAGFESATSVREYHEARENSRIARAIADGVLARGGVR